MGEGKKAMLIAAVDDAADDGVLTTTPCSGSMMP